MAMISGFMNTSSFGKAVGSVGDDWAQFSRDMYRSDAAERLAQMREERELRLADFRAELLAERAARGQGLGSGSARGSRAAARTPEEQEIIARAESGLDRPTFERTRKRDDSGAETVMRPDMSGRGMTGGLDSDEYVRRPEETDESAAAAKNLPAYKRGVMTSLMDFNDYEDYQKGATERRKRETTIEAPTPEARQAGGLGVSAYKGEGPFDESGGTVLNKHTGKNESTEVGKSTIQKNKAAANESNADAANGGKGASKPGRSDKVHSVTSGGDGKVYIVMEDGSRKPMTDESGKHLTSKEYNETRRRIESEIAKSPMFMGERNKDKRMAEVDRQMREIYPEARSTPPINPPPKSGSSNTQSSAAPRYPDGTRLRGKDGKTYVVKNGVPVLEGK